MRLWSVILLAASVFWMSGCTQETQNKLGRAMQNWTGTNGVLDIYEGEKLVMTIRRVSTVTATGTTTRT